MNALNTVLARAAEATVVLGYTAPGYRLNRRTWEDPDLAVDLLGKRCVVTGANSGLGFATATALAKRGASVEMVCRNPERGATALEAVTQAAAAPDAVTLRICDLSSVKQTTELAAELAAGEPIHALVLNAGVLLPERQTTDEGLEVSFATNLLSGFILLRALQDRLADGGRVVHVSSGGMYSQRIDVANLQWANKPWDGVQQYAQTKRAQVILNELWAERGVPSHCMHPGWAGTPGVAFSLPRFDRLLGPILRTSEQGADTIVWLCVADVPAGRFWFDRKDRATHMSRRTRESSEDRAALWTRVEALSEQALG
jgi:dehydrogenase/reductase SDR family protein 12